MASHMSPALLQAQGLLGLTYCNWQPTQEHKNVHLTVVFDPLPAAKINEASISDYGVLSTQIFSSTRIRHYLQHLIHLLLLSVSLT